jgi:uncharacterized membrane protein
MRSSDSSKQRPSAIAWVALAALSGAWLGYGFGQQIGGPWVGLVTALCSGAAASLLADGLADTLRQRIARRQQR